ncbi:helix-turn-helix domain-containing protein [Carnobacterium mobile]|uniref:helix-turn-helix domain-containing protein n=1 Tax=Carnobacterium mobile TaxID=2750 RepID=UPI001868BB6E|nr:helix-turn-helix transcriptional regulator [Carnobacterium mobile]
MSFGEKLQTLRKAKGISQDQLALHLNVSRQAISKWGLGSSLPEVENIIEISRFFDTSIDYLLKDDLQDKEEAGNKAKKTNAALSSSVLLRLSTAFMVIGLLISFSTWYNHQTSEAIVSGMIVQIVGAVLYGIGKMLAKPITILFSPLLNILLMTLIPASVLANLLSGDPLAPYPTEGNAILTFVFLVFVVLGISCFFIRNRRVKKEQV